MQRDVHRVEAEARRFVQEAAPARRFAQEMQPVLSQAMPLMQARGIQHPAQYVAQIVQADRQLSHPDPMVSAQAAASLLRNYNINIEHLARALDSPGAQASQGQQAPVDPRSIAAQVRQEVMQGIQQERQQAITQRMAQEVGAFADDPKNEFFEDVWQDMAAMLDASHARGSKLTMQEAYDRALWANPEKRAILQKRAEAERAKATTATTQQAKLAASSVKSTPSTRASTQAKPAKNHREMVTQAWDQLSES